jgi:CubicO group peptidase (beta-lactamase class C family)
MNNLKYIVALIAISIISISVSAQTEVDNYLNGVYGKGVIPGFSIVVIKNDKVWFAKGYGVESLSDTKIFTPNTVTAIGSLTKSFTALAVMQLVEKGMIDLDGRLTEYIPWFRTANKDKSDKITVRMLLNNTSGLYGGVNPSFDFTGKALENLAHSLEGVYIINEPGKSFEYSNVAFSIAGLLVSKVSGLTYSNYLEENIFKPLKMRKSTTDPEKFIALHSIYGHYYGITKAIPARRAKENESGEFVPAGSVTRSCSADLANYLIFLLQGGQYEGKRIINNESLLEMWKPNSSFYGLSKDDGGENNRVSYCLGWMNTSIENRDIIYHQGSTGTMSSCTMIDRKNKVAASILMNIDVSFIDKYRFPSDINILNNVLRIASGLEKSNYAIPVIKDPTINSFELTEAETEKYKGNYKFVRGDNFIFQGSDIQVKELKNESLQLTALKDYQPLFECKLDFVNEAYAVNRNIATPSSIRFKSNSDGIITGLFMNGSEFIRLSTGNTDNLKTVLSHDRKLSFRVPSDWVKVSDSSKIIFHNSDGVSAIIKTDESVLTTSDDFLKHYSGDSRIIFRGSDLTQSFGNHIWNQSTYVVECKSITNQCIIFSTTWFAKRLFVMFSTPDGMLTQKIQDSFGQIIESFVPPVI